MNLEKLIAALQALDPELPVRFDDGSPVGPLASWRGDYAQLTITTGYPQRTAETVAALLADALAADGATFQGYKGGHFRMAGHTAVYADDWGSCPGFMVAGITVSDGVAVVGRFDGSDY